MAGRSGGGFGALWRIRTRKHIRSIRSIPTRAGPAETAYGEQETARLKVEEERLEAWRAEHEKRRAIQRLLNDR
jgi:hypothetical protein